MTLKKGLTFVAFGFLFISVNINLNLNHLVLDLLPAFVGWIFFALAYSKLGSYTAYRQQFCWIPILLAVYTALDWLLAMLDIALNLPLLNFASLILEAVYLFLVANPQCHPARLSKNSHVEGPPAAKSKVRPFLALMRVTAMYRLTT